MHAMTAEPLRGYHYPKSATGNASIIPAPPWYYSGDLLSVEYRTDPSRVAELLPQPLQLAEDDPGRVAVVWAYWQSCSSDRGELMDPVRAQYQETMVLVRCSHAGATYARCVFIWVDKDFAMARGLLQGFPKKFGSCCMTRSHPVGGAAPRFEAGALFGASLAAADRRLCEASLTLTQPDTSGSPSRFGFGGAPLLHSRQVPSIDPRSGQALDELIVCGGSELEIGEHWTGDADLRLYPSPVEDLARLKVHEMVGGSVMQVGMVSHGGKTVMRTPAPVTAAASQTSEAGAGAQPT